MEADQPPPAPPPGAPAVVWFAWAREWAHKAGAYLGSALGGLTGAHASLRLADLQHCFLQGLAGRPRPAATAKLVATGWVPPV